MTPTELLQQARYNLQIQLSAIDQMIGCNDAAEAAMCLSLSTTQISDYVASMKDLHIEADKSYELARTAATKTMLRYYDTKRPSYVYNETNTAALPGEIDRRMSGLENISN